jgi:hypothetical protein
MIRDVIKQYAMYGTEAEFADEHQELEEKLSCEHCGFLQASVEESAYLEEQWNTGVGPTYVDVCTCEEGKEDLLAAVEEFKDEFFMTGKRTTISDGYYDVAGIERVFLNAMLEANDHGTLIEALALMEKETACCAKPYGVETVIILERTPPEVEIEFDGDDASFAQGTCCVIKGAPKELLILHEND